MAQYPPVSAAVPGLLHGGDYNPDQWLKHPEILREDLRLMKLAGINCVSLGIFAWAALEPQEGVYTFEWMDQVIDSLYENGIYTILATPSGARPAWMDQKYPEVRRINAQRVRELHGGRHNHCNTSPRYNALVTEMNTRLAQRYGQHPGVIAWHVSNEYSGECFCPLCQQAFRDWLQKKYGTIDALNEAWWSSFWSHRFSSFEEIEAPAPHGEQGIHGMNLDWMRFNTWKCAQFIKVETAPLKELTPQLPVTTNFMGSGLGPTYGGLNYQQLTEDLDRISWDSYPRWHQLEEPDWRVASRAAFVYDLARSLGQGQPFLLMESTPSLVNWQPVNRMKRPGLHETSSLQAVAHGSDSVQYFQWRKSRGATEKLHGAVVDHCGHEHTRVFQEVAHLGQSLKRLAPVAGAGVPVQAAVVYDWETRWAVEDLQGLSRYRDYEETCALHHRALWRHGIAADVISQDQPLDGYRLVAAPMLYLLKPGFSEKAEAFVRSGGILVATFCTGWTDENDLCYLGGWPGAGLQKVFGLWEEELDSLYPGEENQLLFTDLLAGTYPATGFCARIHPQQAQVLARYQRDFYAGEPAVTVNSYGDGHAYYLAAGAGEELLFDFYRVLAERAGLSSALPGVALPLGVSAVRREGDGGSFCFVMNFTDRTQPVELTQPELDLLTGNTRRSLNLPPYGTAVLYTERTVD